MNESIGRNLGRRLRELREAAHMTQADLAQLSLKSVETISNFERGKTIPSVVTLHSLATHLGCEVTDFFRVELATKEAPFVTLAVVSRMKLLGDRDQRLVEGIVDLLVSEARK